MVISDAYPPDPEVRYTTSAERYRTCHDESTTAQEETKITSFALLLRSLTHAGRKTKQILQ